MNMKYDKSSKSKYLIPTTDDDKCFNTHSKSHQQVDRQLKIKVYKDLHTYVSMHYSPGQVLSHSFIDQIQGEMLD